jgi:hypothetical protein
MKKLLAAVVIISSIIACKKEVDVSPEINSPVEAVESPPIDTSGPDAELVELEATNSSALTPSLILPTSNFALGVNGHPFNSPAYTSQSPSKQISLVKTFHLKYYRFDIPLHSDGSVQSPNLFGQLVNSAKQNGIQLVPTISASGIKFTQSTSQNYNAGKSKGRNFAMRYAGNFTYYGLGNEIDNTVILKNRSGQQTSDYDGKKMTIVAAYLRGMNDGIKQADPGAKTMIDESFLHYAFLQILQRQGVNFDIVACHWYADMEALAGKSPYNVPDIAAKLSSLFSSKEIWFSEVNKRYKNVTSTWHTQQIQFFQNFIIKCKRQSRVKAILIYELFDEPTRNGLEEQSFGIIKWLRPYSSMQYKPFASNLANMK